MHLHHRVQNYAPPDLLSNRSPQSSFLFLVRGRDCNVPDRHRFYYLHPVHHIDRLPQFDEPAARHLCSLLFVASAAETANYHDYNQSHSQDHETIVCVQSQFPDDRVLRFRCKLLRCLPSSTDEKQSKIHSFHPAQWYLVDSLGHCLQITPKLEDSRYCNSLSNHAIDGKGW